MNDKGQQQYHAAIVGLIILAFLAASCQSRQQTNKQDREVTGPSKTISTAPATRITKANYEKLREGMKESEVIAILGPVSEVKFEAKNASGSSGVYQWGTAEDGFIICSMGNEKLVSKTQISLRY